ncbi:MULTISPECIES: peptidoglycan editing factor PgeF [Methylomonas]|uniref:peptidoglycan editing factor PgeF n=1 Tax=Methylomonas TaxID=416 RepID=UPI0012325D99|nr:peptidoglycan editing factor PgeF [Methylomonas rhizoryzae]
MNWIRPDWPLPSTVQAATTLRDGGVSLGCYASLNPADHVGDNPEHVARNRELIREGLGLPGEPVWLQQVHGVRVVKADQTIGLECADASYTDRAGVVCAVLTADCLPVLFCGDRGEVIAAAHAGWRGLQAGVIGQTLLAMQCRDVSVWLGPAIGPAHFEVGDEVRTAFVDSDPVHSAAFRAVAPGKWLADLYGLARQQLRALGVDAVYGGGDCTVADGSRFFSYRRDGTRTGRMASLIWRN